LESTCGGHDLATDSARDAASALGLIIPAEAKFFPPKFNRLVVFSVPRFHQVTPVVPQPIASPAPRLRLSIFGWFMQPGRLYPLISSSSSNKKKKSTPDASFLDRSTPRKRTRRGSSDDPK
jgi:hypothetical protein